MPHFAWIDIEYARPEKQSQAKLAETMPKAPDKTHAQDQAKKTDKGDRDSRN